MRITLALGAALAASVCVARAQEAAVYASPAIDRSLFRDGELKRLTGTFSGWEVSCDEIAKLRQRFCSLYGVGTDVAGRPLFSVIVSTGDDGKPAAMLRLPPALQKPRLIEISPAASEPAHGKKPKHAEKPQRLRTVSCDATGCLTLWRLAPQEIAALGAGPGLSVRFAFADAPAGGELKATISGAGFAAGVAATLDAKWAGGGNPPARTALAP